MSDFEPAYVGVPYAKESETSHAAAVSIVDRAETDAAIIEDFIRKFRRYGCTCDEVERKLGYAHQTASARINQLRKEERLILTDRKRKTRADRDAGVYVTPEHYGRRISDSSV